MRRHPLRPEDRNLGEFLPFQGDYLLTGCRGSAFANGYLARYRWSSISVGAEGVEVTLS